MKALDRQTTPQIALPTLQTARGRPGAPWGAGRRWGRRRSWPAPSAPPGPGTGRARRWAGRGPGGGDAGRTGGPADRAPQPDSAVLRWNEAALAAIRATRPAPPVAARALAILHTAIFDAWAHFDVVASTRVGAPFPPLPGSLAGAATRLVASTRAGAPGGAGARPASQRAVEYKRAAVSAAAHLALRHLFPTRTSGLRTPC